MFEVHYNPKKRNIVTFTWFPTKARMLPVKCASPDSYVPLPMGAVGDILMDQVPRTTLLCGRKGPSAFLGSRRVSAFSGTSWVGNFEVGAKVIPPPSCDEGFCQQVWCAACTEEMKSSAVEVLSAGKCLCGGALHVPWYGCFPGDWPEQDCVDFSGSLR